MSAIQGHGKGSLARLIVGISGASGAIYGIRLLQISRELGVESHLVMSKAAEMTISYETEMTPAAVKQLVDLVYPIGDLAASISSGSFPTRNMLALSDMGAVIAPPVPAFYNRPATIGELVDHSVGRVLDLFGFDSGRVRRWGDAQSRRKPR